MLHRFEPSVALLTLLLLAPCLGNTAASDINPTLLEGMKWRQIGPFRGGRVVAVSGVPGDPATWYFGGVGGGVWKSTDVGASWKPVFDAQKISSIGAIAVADSDHNVIYVGTGEACPRGNITYGDGVYKSVDAGRTWKNIGLERHAPDRRRDRASEKSRHRAGRRAGTRVRSQRGARRIPHRRRRPHLDQGAVQGSGHRRDRRRLRSGQSEHRLCLAVADAPSTVEFLQRRPGLRALQVDGCRSHVEASRGPRPACRASWGVSACRSRAAVQDACTP